MDIIKLLIDSPMGKKVASKILTNVLMKHFKNNDIRVCVKNVNALHKQENTSIDVGVRIEMNNDALLKIIYENLK